VGVEQVIALTIKEGAHQVGLEGAAVLVRQQLEPLLDHSACITRVRSRRELHGGLQLLQSAVREDQKQLAEGRCKGVSVLEPSQPLPLDGRGRRKPEHALAPEHRPHGSSSDRRQQTDLPALEGEPCHVALEREVRHLRHSVRAGRHPQQLVEERVVRPGMRLGSRQTAAGAGELGRKRGGTSEQDEQVERDDRRADPSAMRHHASGGDTDWIGEG
jgi:hypothetical protein